MMSPQDVLGSDLPGRIYKHHEATRDDWRRDHLGASIIGGPCDRAIWYSWRWAQAPKHDGRLLRLFETGQLAEDRIIKELQGIGIDVTSQQYKVTFCDGHGGGSLDGVGQGFSESNAHHVLEFKTHGQKSFDSLLKDGLQKAKPMHYTQMTMYMGLAGLDRAYYIAVNKNTDEIYAERIKLDRQHFEAMLKRAESIVASKLPPARMTDNPAYYLCKFCDYSTMCHAQDVPAVNCRTCCHASPVHHGKWICEKDGGDLSGAFQREACSSHLFIPHLLNQEAVTSGNDWIQYNTWTNGPDHTKSKEYRPC